MAEGGRKRGKRGKRSRLRLDSTKVSRHNMKLDEFRSLRHTSPYQQLLRTQDINQKCHLGMEVLASCRYLKGPESTHLGSTRRVSLSLLIQPSRAAKFKIWSLKGDAEALPRTSPVFGWARRKPTVAVPFTTRSGT